MAQARKKTATRTAKKSGARAGAGRKASTRTYKKRQQMSQSERMHLYIVTAMAMIAGILLCANAAMMIA